MSAQDFFNNSVTITPVFSQIQDPVKIEVSNNDFDDFSSWIKCEFCDYRCPKKDRLSRHVRNVHFKEKPFGCTLCDAAFGRKDKMKRHLATVHSQERPFKCDFCNHSSGRKDKIREHIQSVHLKTRPPRPKKKYPKKKVEKIEAAEVNPEMLHLPQHPLPRNELYSGLNSHGLVTLTPVNFATNVNLLATSMQPLDIQYNHQPAVVTVANPEPIFKLVT